MPRPRKPSLLRQLEGNRGKRAIPSDIPPDGVPAPSAAVQSLGAEAVADWSQLVQQIGADLLRQQDGRLLELAVLLRHHLWLAHQRSDRRALVQLAGRYQQVLRHLGIGPGERIKYTLASDDERDELFS